MTFDMRRRGRLLACVALTCATAACATVTRGTKEAWMVSTVPPSASVKTSNGFACDATPCTFKIEHKAEFDVTISKPGYKTFHTRVIHQVSTAGGAGMAGNVLLGGLIGAGVDVATGAMMELKPNPLNVTLEATDAPAVAVVSPSLLPASPAAASPSNGAGPSLPMTPSKTPAV